MFLEITIGLSEGLIPPYYFFMGAMATIKLCGLDDDRYDHSRMMEWLDLDAVFEAKVLLVKAGALGNEVAKDIVR